MPRHTCRGSRLPRLFLGGHGGEATPVPIPNTEVKGPSGEGTAAIGRGRVARRQGFLPGPSDPRDRAAPSFCFRPLPRGIRGHGEHRKRFGRPRLVLPDGEAQAAMQRRCARSRPDGRRGLGPRRGAGVGAHGGADRREGGEEDRGGDGERHEAFDERGARATAANRRGAENGRPMEGDVHGTRPIVAERACEGKGKVAARSSASRRPERAGRRIRARWRLSTRRRRDH